MATSAGRRMRVLVCPHELVTGGSQINAIDLATGLRDRGHEVTVFAPRGPLVDVIDARGLDYIAAEPPRHRLGAWPTSTMTRSLRALRPDIVHTFEAPPSVASTVTSMWLPHRNVTTVLSMDVPDFLPHDVPLIVGTRELAQEASGAHSRVYLMEPPIDTSHDAPGDVAASRAGLSASRRWVVSVVGRLSHEHEKAAGVARALNELGTSELCASTTVLVAGDGDAAGLVADAADSARRRGLDVRLLGDVRDARAVYDAADVVFGMGSSALRAMAHEKPVIVQGAAGYWRVASPASMVEFFEHGFFGRGSEGGGFLSHLEGLLTLEPEERAALGRYGRRVVIERYALDRALDSLEAVYRAELERPRRRLRAEAVGAAVRYARFRAAVSFPRVHRAFRTVAGRSRA